MDKIFKVIAITLFPALLITTTLADTIYSESVNFFWYACVVLIPAYNIAFFQSIYYLFWTKKVNENRITWILLLIPGFFIGLFPFILPFFWYLAINNKEINIETT